MSMENETATDQSAQDITSRIESALFDEAEVTEPVENEDEVAVEDEVTLPETDDTDSEEEDGSDLEDIASDEDLSLADYLGIPEDRINVAEDGTVSMTAIIDGESKEVSLKDLASSFQLQGHVNNKSIALENERKELEAAKQQIATEYQSKLQNLESLTSAAEQQLVGDFNQIDWDRLRVENPAEWTALRQEFADKAQHIQNVQAQVKQEGKALLDQQQEKVNQQRQQHLQGEFTKMLESNPAWSDEVVRKKDMDEMRTFVTGQYGFTEQDLALVTDHRLINLIQDAKAYRNGKKAAETKIVKKVPKFQKPGATKAQHSATAKARSVKAKRAAVKKTGSTQDVANLILDRM